MSLISDLFDAIGRDASITIVVVAIVALVVWGLSESIAIQPADLMSTIDKQRVAALRKLEDDGYKFNGSEWVQPQGNGMAEADALHALLVKRVRHLAGGTDGLLEETELSSIIDAIQAYEAVRWPNGRQEGGKL